MIQQPLSFLRFKRQPPVPKEATPSNRIDMFFSPTEGKFKATDEAGNAVYFDSDAGGAVGSVTFTSGILQGQLSPVTLTEFRTWRLPDESGSIVVRELSSGGNASEDEDKVVIYGPGGFLIASDRLQIERTGTGFNGQINVIPITADRDYTLPDASGTFALVGASARVPYTYVVASDVTNATTSMANVTGLAFPVLANKKYAVVLHLATNKNDASGIRLQLTGPSSPTMVDGSAAGTTVDDNTFVTLSFLAFASETATFNTVSGNGRVRAGTMLIANGANAGTVQLQFRSVTGGTSTIRAGSWIQVTQLD